MQRLYLAYKLKYDVEFANNFKKQKKANFRSFIKEKYKPHDPLNIIESIPEIDLASLPSEQKAVELARALYFSSWQAWFAYIKDEKNGLLNKFVFLQEDNIAALESLLKIFKEKMIVIARKEDAKQLDNLKKIKEHDFSALKTDLNTIRNIKKAYDKDASSLSNLTSPNFYALIKQKSDPKLHSTVNEWQTMWDTKSRYVRVASDQLKEILDLLKVVEESFLENAHQEANNSLASIAPTFHQYFYGTNSKDLENYNAIIQSFRNLLLQERAAIVETMLDRIALQADQSLNFTENNNNPNFSDNVMQDFIKTHLVANKILTQEYYENLPKRNLLSINNIKEFIELIKTYGTENQIKLLNTLIQQKASNNVKLLPDSGHVHVGASELGLSFILTDVARKDLEKLFTPPKEELEDGFVIINKEELEKECGKELKAAQSACHLDASLNLENMLHHSVEFDVDQFLKDNQINTPENHTFFKMRFQLLTATENDPKNITTIAQSILNELKELSQTTHELQSLEQSWIMVEESVKLRNTQMTTLAEQNEKLKKILEKIAALENLITNKENENRPKDLSTSWIYVDDQSEIEVLKEELKDLKKEYEAEKKIHEQFLNKDEVFDCATLFAKIKELQENCESKKRDIRKEKDLLPKLKKMLAEGKEKVDQDKIDSKKNVNFMRLYLVNLYQNNAYVELDKKLAQAEKDITDLEIQLKNCTGVDLSGKDLSKLNLSGYNFKNADLSNCNLQGATFKEANLNGTCLAGANLERATFFDTIIINTNFSKAIMPGVDLSQVKKQTIAAANFSGADLSAANLQALKLAHIKGIDFTNAILNNTNLSNINCQNVNFTNASLENAILINTDLSEATMAGTKFSKNANLPVTLYIESSKISSQFYMQSKNDKNISFEEIQCIKYLHENLKNEIEKIYPQTNQKHATDFLKDFNPTFTSYKLHEMVAILRAERRAMTSDHYGNPLYIFQATPKTAEAIATSLKNSFETVTAKKPPVLTGRDLLAHQLLKYVNSRELSLKYIHARDENRYAMECKMDLARKLAHHIIVKNIDALPELIGQIKGSFSNEPHSKLMSLVNKIESALKPPEKSVNHSHN